MQRVHRIPSPFQKQMKSVPSAILTYARPPFKLYSSAFSISGAADLGLYEHPYIPKLPIDLITQTVYGYDYLFAEESTNGGEEVLINEERTAAILNTLQYRLMRSNGASRVERWRKEPISGIVSTALKELEARIRGWQWYREQSVLIDDSHMLVARQAALDWGAKLICTLAMELELIQKGRDIYEHSYANELLPWQRMNLDISGL